MRMARVLSILVMVLAVSACRGGIAPGAVAPAEPVTLVVATHDSFAVSEPVVAAFEAAHNARVQFLTLGDAGVALNKVILSKDAPLADVFFGVDNTFLSRALDASIFVPYASPLLAQIPDALELDAEHRLLPVDFGFVTLNADPAWFAERGLALPTMLEDLADPAYRGLLVVQNPATSSPGLAFLLATVAHFGEEGYQTYWQALRANDVLVTDDWSEAYFERFTVGSGGTGDRPLVVSYSTSPPADVVYATDGRTQPASINLLLPGGAFQQVEFAGVLAGAKQPELARQFVDYMLDITFQQDIPLQMFVYPANSNAALPELFTTYAQTPEEPATLDPAAIEANREAWIEGWAEVMR